jgi:hypothetical protein
MNFTFNLWVEGASACGLFVPDGLYKSLVAQMPEEFSKGKNFVSLHRHQTSTNIITK